MASSSEAALLAQHAGLGLEETAPGFGDKAQLAGTLRRSVEEGARLEGGADRHETLALGPIDRLDDLAPAATAP